MIFKNNDRMCTIECFLLRYTCCLHCCPYSLSGGKVIYHIIMRQLVANLMPDADYSESTPHTILRHGSGFDQPDKLKLKR